MTGIMKVYWQQEHLILSGAKLSFHICVEIKAFVVHTKTSIKIHLCLVGLQYCSIKTGRDPTQEGPCPLLNACPWWPPISGAARIPELRGRHVHIFGPKEKYRRLKRLEV